MTTSFDFEERIPCSSGHHFFVSKQELGYAKGKLPLKESDVSDKMGGKVPGADHDAIFTSAVGSLFKKGK